MRRREFMALVGGCAVWWPRTVLAQQPANVPIIGLLLLGTEAPDYVEALREGMRDHGLIDGVNVRLLIRYAEDPDRLPHVARGLAAAGSRLIVTGGTTSVKAVQTALPDMTIVMFASADPVTMGFAQSLARPGGKITGMSILGADLIGKHIELLKELLPAAKSFAAILQAANPGNGEFRRAFVTAARSLGVEIHVREILTIDALTDVLDWASKVPVDGVYLIQDPIFYSNRFAISRLAETKRLPLVAGASVYVQAGALAAYGLDNHGVTRESGSYVARILRGADPAELPIQQPTRFRLAVNLKTAKALGLTIPPALLARADELIE
jgi:putative ABC transport system substrate-binding protein